MNVATNTVAPATAYQLYLVNACGHSLTRGPANIWQLEANPERMEFTAGGTGHIPYADENAADDFAASQPGLHWPRRGATQRGPIPPRWSALARGPSER